MKLLNKWNQRVARVRQKTTKFGREVKSRLRDQFTKRNKGSFESQFAVDQKFAQLGYEPLNNTNRYNEVLHGTGYELDPSLSNEETKVFHNPTTRQVSMAYRGMPLNKPSRWKDLKSDLAILMGQEKYDTWFKQVNHHFKGVLDKYGDGYNIDTTGHSLGGQLAKHVNDSHKGRVARNVVFSRGTGLLEPFRKKQGNTVDVSNKHDVISMGARLQGGHPVVKTSNKGLLEAHNLGALYH